jgi:thioesterase domain-containing protein/acyl carrier protein
MMPSRFVVLERLPLNPNGKVDIAALPSPPDLVRAGYLAPRTLLELRLAEIWEEVLGVSAVGVRDDFFELGGHSLLAVHLVSLIRERLRKEVSLAMILERPTVAALAEGLSAGLEPGSYEPLVPLRATGCRPPLFCVHPFGGNVLCYVDLVRELSPDQPFYGLQAPDRPEDPVPFTTVEEIASCYIESIRRAQPQGPYRIAGWSFGGRVALEIAQQLQDLGEEVELLAVFDTRIDQGTDQGPDDELDEEFDDTKLLVQMVPAQLGLTAEALRALPEDSRVEHVYALLRREGCLPAGYGLNEAQRQREVWKAHARAARSFRPRPYEGRIAIFRAADEPLNQGSALGWGRLSTRVEVYEVPGDHQTMMEQPQVRALAEALHACLLRSDPSAVSTKAMV